MLSGIEGAFSTTVRAVLTPHPMKEMRVKNNYVQHKVVRAAQVRSSQYHLVMDLF